LKKFGTFKVAALVLTLVLALTLVGVGGAFAAGAFPVHTTTLQGSVSEAFTISGVSGNGWNGATWTVSAKPGETATLVLNIHNSASVDLLAYVAVSSGCAVVTGPGDVWVPAGGDKQVSFSWTVDPSSQIGTCTNTITISR